MQVTDRERGALFALRAGRLRNAAAELCRGLSLLQHRGRESCGLIVGRGDAFRACAGVGTVAEGLDEQALASLGVGRCAAGYVRGVGAASAFVAEHAALVLEGYLTKGDKLREVLAGRGVFCRTAEDAEAVCRLWLSARNEGASEREALVQTLRRLQGAFALVLLTADELLAARDPRGACPLCIGELPDGGYAFASESCALDGGGLPFLRDVAPGELVAAGDGGLETLLPPSDRGRALCALELLAAARADSVLDGVAVSSLRGRAGSLLALEHAVRGDVVAALPGAEADAALGYAQQSGIPFVNAFVENRYVSGFFAACPARGFNPVAAAVRGKRVVLVGDRVNGQAVALLRGCGAREVHLRVMLPICPHPCRFGGAPQPDAGMGGADTVGYLSARHVHLLAGGLCADCMV